MAKSSTAPRTQAEPIKRLVLTRTFDAPRAAVFQAWTDPKQISKWFGPKGYTIPRCELDVRPGGKIRMDMGAPDGTVFPGIGEYLEVVPNERLVFRYVPIDANGEPFIDGLTTVTFDDHAGKTRLTVEATITSAVPGSEMMVAGMNEGWNQTLDNLVAFVGVKR